MLDADSYMHNWNAPFVSNSAYLCQAACQLEINCLFFVYIMSKKYCFFKFGNYGDYVSAPGSVSGPKFCEGKV